MKLGLYTFLFLTFFLLQCTFLIDIKPKPDIKVEKKIPVSVSLKVSQDARSERYQKDGMVFVGIAHTWIFPVGEALESAALHSMKQVFQEASLNKDKKYKLILEPSMKEFRISQVATVTLVLELILVKKYKANLSG